ncbi:MAG: ribosome maturation factor RimM [Rhizomicrobium sp.]
MILLGVVIGAQGLRGELRVKTFTETPERLAAYGRLCTKDGRTLNPTDARALKPDIAILRLQGVDDRDAAEALKGVELFVARDALPAAADDEFYHADLVGLRAEDAEGRLVGEVRAIHNFGAGDVIELVRPDGGNLFLSFTRETVPEIDVKEGRIVVVEPPDDAAFEERGVE